MLSEEDYQLKKRGEKLVADRDNVKRSLDTDDQQSDEWNELTVKTFNFATAARKKFESGDTETKKLILRGIGSYQIKTRCILHKLLLHPMISSLGGGYRGRTCYPLRELVFETSALPSCPPSSIKNQIQITKYSKQKYKNIYSLDFGYW